ncbi:hypothetical protein RQP46_002039 [Phenoliferia psychrophenolica]
MSGRDEELHSLYESAISSFKASISVILIGTTFLLPALLFTEIGPLATVENLKSYGIIIPITLLLQVVSLFVGESSRALGMPQHYVPMFVFNNATSLPLLLITALSTTGSLDGLVPINDTLAAVLKRGRVYILINSLVGNLTRFGLGPYLMKTHRESFWAHPHHDDPDHEPALLISGSSIRLPETESDAGISGDPTKREKIQQALQKAQTFVVVALNPPLIGGFLAIFFGIIPWFHRQLFNSSGWLTPVADSVANVGNLYTALQMFVLGAHLYSKKGSGSQPLLLVWLFAYRFFIAPAIAIGMIYGIRKTWPNLIDDDPILDFVLMISNAGPPALTLSAIAEMADLSADVEGAISRIITLSYAVTPLIAFPVTAALEVVRHSRDGTL